MDRQSNMVLRTIFLWGILLFSGTSVYPHADTQLIHHDSFTVTLNEGLPSGTEVDSYDDEHINPDYEIHEVVDNSFLMPVFGHPASFFNYSTSFWQPPKISE